MVTGMNGTLAERMDHLEKEVEKIKSEIAGKPNVRDWHAWYGTSKDDPGFDEMIRLGREYRQRQREDYDLDDDARS